ncbi:hypothetical protein EU546_04735, partial [Candidatus Thorarchaeota archaeon]
MEPRENEPVVPASVTHPILLDVGPSMEQSVPEDYVLASLLLRTLQVRDANELEFILKGYLPIVIEPGGAGQLVLMERVGLSAVSFTPVSEYPVRDIDFSEISSADHLLSAIESLVKDLSEVERKERISVLGLLQGEMAEGVMATLNLPTLSSVENYAVEIPSVLEAEKNDPLSQLLSTAYDIHRSRELIELLGRVERAVQEALEGETKGHSPTIQRLTMRIERLEREISTIQSRIQAMEDDLGPRRRELGDLLKNRQKALKRDLKRRAELTQRNRSASEALHRAFERLRDSVDRTTGIYQEVEQQLHQILVDSEDVPVSEGPLSLLLPVYLIGFSKKGVLEVEVLPPLHYQETGQRVGLMREFVDTLTPMNEGLVKLASRLEEAIDRNPSLMQDIRLFSRTKNLLALENTQEMIREGGSLLLAEGVARESMIQKMEGLLRGIPIRKVDAQEQEALIIPEDGSGTK